MREKATDTGNWDGCRHGRPECECQGNVEQGKMSLFQKGYFQLNSGQFSMFKIDCDALTDGDIETIALMLVHRLPAFGYVIGVPRGGIRLAEAMKPFRVEDCNTRLIVDDVLTTGGSMERFKHDMYVSLIRPYVIGAVIFARSEFPCPDWITPLFRMEP